MGLRERLQARLVELEKMREQLAAQLNAVLGAITEIEAALRPEQEEPPQKADT